MNFSIHDLSLLKDSNKKTNITHYAFSSFVTHPVCIVINREVEDKSQTLVFWFSDILAKLQEDEFFSWEKWEILGGMPGYAPAQAGVASYNYDCAPIMSSESQVPLWISFQRTVEYFYYIITYQLPYQLPDKGIAAFVIQKRDKGQPLLHVVTIFWIKQFYREHSKKVTRVISEIKTDLFERIERFQAASRFNAGDIITKEYLATFSKRGTLV